MRRPNRLRALIVAVCALAAIGLPAVRAGHDALAQIVPNASPLTQVKTRDTIRASVSDAGSDAVSAALQRSLQQADVQETDPLLKGAIEQTLNNPNALADATVQVTTSLGGGEQSVTVPVYNVDALGGTIAVLNLQVTRVNPETGRAQPSQHDELRSDINNQLAKDVGEAVLNAKRVTASTPTDAAEQSRKTLTSASSAANATFDAITNNGQTGDQQAAARFAVQQTDQQVLQSLGATGPAPVQSAITTTPGLCIVAPPSQNSELTAC